MFNESQVISLWESLENKKYEIISFLKSAGYVKYVTLKNKQNDVKNTGKIISTLSHNELCYWPHLHHRSLALFLERVEINEFYVIYISPYMKESLRDVIHRHEFLYHSDCFNLKKIYIEDILWGCDYLHRKSLCLFNVNDENIFICHEENKAVIADLSCLNKSHQGANHHFNLPALYKAPELNNKELLAYPIPVEIWSIGVLVLEMFLSHMVPWGLIDFDPSRAQEILSKIDDKIVKVANYGSVLSQIDINEFKCFASCFLRKRPQNRCSAKSAAVTKFIQSARQQLKRFANCYECSSGNTHLKQQYYQRINQIDSTPSCKKEKFSEEFEDFDNSFSHSEFTVTIPDDKNSDLSEKQTESSSSETLRYFTSGDSDNGTDEIPFAVADQINSPKELLKIMNADFDEPIPQNTKVVVDNNTKLSDPKVKYSITGNKDSTFHTKPENHYNTGYKIKSFEKAQFQQTRDYKKIKKLTHFHKNCNIQFREVKSAFGELNYNSQQIHENEVLNQQSGMKKCKSDSDIKYRCFYKIELPSINLPNNFDETASKNYFGNIEPVFSLGLSKTSTTEIQLNDTEVNLKDTNDSLMLSKVNNHKVGKLDITREIRTKGRENLKSTDDLACFSTADKHSRNNETKQNRKGNLKDTNDCAIFNDAKNNKMKRMAETQPNGTVNLKDTNGSFTLNNVSIHKRNIMQKTSEIQLKRSVNLEDTNNPVNFSNANNHKININNKTMPICKASLKDTNNCAIFNKTENHKLEKINETHPKTAMSFKHAVSFSNAEIRKMNIMKPNNKILFRLQRSPINQTFFGVNYKDSNQVKQKNFKQKEKIGNLEQKHIGGVEFRTIKSKEIEPKEYDANSEFHLHTSESNHNDVLEIPSTSSMFKNFQKKDTFDSDLKNSFYCDENLTEITYNDKDLLIKKKNQNYRKRFSYIKAVTKSNVRSNDSCTTFSLNRIPKRHNKLGNPVEKRKDNFENHGQLHMTPKVTFIRHNLSNKQKCEITKLLLQTEKTDEGDFNSIEAVEKDKQYKTRNTKSKSGKSEVIKPSGGEIAKKKRRHFGHCFYFKKQKSKQII